MNSSFAPYIDLYVYRKKNLFPLIESYSGRSLKGLSHGEAIGLYVNLLKTNDSFRDEVEKLVKGNYKNAADPVTAIADAVGKIFGTIQQSSETRANLDTNLSTLILEKQKQANNQKLLITGGIILISVLIIGGSIYFLIKRK